MFAHSYPNIQGFQGAPATAIDFLRQQYLTGNTSNGTATVFLTDDGTQDGQAMFSIVNHVTVTPSSSDPVWATVGPLSADHKSFSFTVLQSNGMGGIARAGAVAYTIAVFGQP